MERIKAYFINVSEFISFINALFTLGGFLCAIILKRMIVFIKRYKLKSVMSFNNNRFTISIPLYKSTINTHIDEYVLKTEASLQQKLITFLEKVNMEYEHLPESYDNIYNEIHIGSQTTNTKTSTYIKNFFPNFIHRVDPSFVNSISQDNLERVFPQTYESSEKEGFVYGDNESDILPHIANEQDYAIIIKLTKSDLKENKTVHLLFGASRIGTQAAVNYLISNYSDLYIKFKKKHYFIAIPVNKKDGSINLSKLKDLTAKMFINST